MLETALDANYFAGELLGTTVDANYSTRKMLETTEDVHFNNPHQHRIVVGVLSFFFKG